MTRLTFAVIGVVLMFLATKWMRGLFGKPTLADLRFPVLVLPPGNAEPFSAAEAGDLTTIPDKNATSPTDGTILIDSDFAQYEEVEVQALPQGEISAIFHALIPVGRSYHYKFALKRVKTTGLAAALAQLNACVSYPGDSADLEKKRTQIAAAKTVDEIVAILRVEPPPPAAPDTAPAVPETAPLDGEQPPRGPDGRG